ncbi:TPA: multidrug MFS transporter, partial [Streptococcus pneumoniae]
MIFVTVGTHEQQFDRLIKEVDYLKKENLIQDEVF